MKEKKIFQYYTKFKQWLRKSKTGIAIDRAVRFFVITAITTFLTNYAIGEQVIPVIQSSVGVAAIALYDKLKNEWFAGIRHDDEITRI